ncbi:MAG TPA: aspartate carbamoyltransferase catalytic subunit, partial [Steroidobacteraceae bacterium]
MRDATTAQLRPDGSLRHLLTLDGLSRTQLETLLERAAGFVRPLGVKPAMSQALTGATVANLFTEPSTRTRVSFELAAKRLGAQVVNLEMQLSSRVKGESMLDTVYTLQSMQVDAFVIRDAEAGVPQLVAAHVAPHVSVLSAGEAHLSHPTQGLLDALTIRQN